MFSKIVDTDITPNFLNSIFTNKSLYDMFKNDYENNKEYFANKEKDEYLNAMLNRIENMLYEKDLESYNFDAIKLFFDDFLIDEFQNSENMLKTKLFRGLNYYLSHNQNREFKNLYDYIFDKVNYTDRIRSLINPIKAKLENKEELTINEYDILTNYVKNNIHGYTDINIVNNMIRLHAYKSNHIFDKDVVKELIKSILRDYTDMKIKVNYLEEGDITNNEIYIPSELIDKFIFGNYVELLDRMFYEVEKVKMYNALINKKTDTYTLKVLENMLYRKVDLDRIFVDDTYYNASFMSDLKASSFIKAMRYLSSIGVNLWNSYIDNRLNHINIEYTDKKVYSDKEISLDMLFFKRLDKIDSDIINRYDVLNIICDNGKERNTIDIIKKYFNKDREFIEEYLTTRIIEPEKLIYDVKSLSEYRTKNDDIKALIEKLVKYIYVDTFYYSLENYLKMNNTKEEYLDELKMQVKLIKDTPLTHRFIDEALMDIGDMKQS